MSNRSTSYERHGMSRSVEHNAWTAMICRCYTPTNDRYQYYGGRGITVCDRWRHSFSAFLEDVGPRPSPAHSLDRINVDGHYEPSNCRWATRTEQNRNMRRNRQVTLHGRTMTLAEWCREIGIDRRTVSSRLRRGWPIETAITTAANVRPE